MDSINLTPFFKNHNTQIIATICVFVTFPIIKYILRKVIIKYGAHANITELRTKLILKYCSSLINILAFVSLITIWGVTPEWIYASLASVFAIVGVAFFAQWSILSNVTAGIIIYFTAPFKMGDTIEIMDKEFPLQATVEDIKAFHMYLKTKDGRLVACPNNLVLQKAVIITNCS